LKEIFTYNDFQEYLRDRLAHLKEGDRTFTYRRISAELGIKSPGYITQVLNGTRTLSAKLTPEFARVLELKRRETIYFETLVSYNQARQKEKRAQLLVQLTELKKRSQTKLDPESYLYFEEWYYAAIRSIIDFVPFDGTNFGDIANIIVPKISEVQVEKAIKVLIKMELIQKKEDGFYTLADRHLTTGLNSDSVVLNNYVINTTDIAKEALYHFPVEERSFSALTLSVSDTCYKEVKDKIAKFRREVLDMVAQDSETVKACQLNIQLFPLSERWQEND
jgi:uncharacterized protein (TIGR02147 family)